MMSLQRKILRLQEVGVIASLINLIKIAPIFYQKYQKNFLNFSPLKSSIYACKVKGFQRQRDVIFFLFSLIERVDNWRHISLAVMNCSSSTTPEDDISLKGPESFTQASEKMPEFPLVPASKGFCLSLDKSVESLKSALKAQNISFCD